MTALLVIACSGYPRRFRDPAYDADRALYLKQQHHSLTRLQYSCDVVLVNSGGESAYLEYLDTLRGTYRVIDKENTGMSLGAFGAAWRANPDYDYYILLEDDYIFVLDYFDDEMIDLMGTAENCGYICQVANSDGHHDLYPAFMNGIASRALLERLGSLPSEGVPSRHEAGDQQQKDFGTQIKESEFELADMGAMFQAPFTHTRSGEFTVVTYYSEAPHQIIVPSQVYTREL